MEEFREFPNENRIKLECTMKFRAEYLIFIVGFLLLILENAMAQNNWYETDQYICWQESRELIPTNFQGVVGDFGYT